MQGFKNYLSEGKKPSGAEFESIICAAYNMKAKGIDKEAAVKLAGTEWKADKFDPWLDVGHEIVKNAFGDKPSGKMEHYGAGTAELSDNWEAFFIKATGKKAGASTKTPKTDMYIGNQHISLKKYGGSQLMSGGKAETLATFMMAYDKVPARVKNKKLDAAWNKLVRDIEKDFVSFSLPKGGQITDYKKAIKAGVKDKMTDWVKDKLEKQTVMTDAIRDILMTPEVNLEVVREAMTGNQKFKDKLPIANYIMKFDEAGKADYVKIDDAYTKTVASQTRFNISFKTSGTGGQAWTATKGIFKESYTTQLVEDAYNEAMVECLNEGIFDKIKNAARKGANFLKNALSKMLAYIWGKIKSMISRSILFAQQLFGVKMVVNDPKVKF